MASQRVALGRAFIQGPKAFLLDGLFSAFDNPIRLEMMTLLRDIRNKFDIPVVLVTHDIFEVYTMADKVMRYSGGGVTKISSQDEIFHLLPKPEVKPPLKGFS